MKRQNSHLSSTSRRETSPETLRSKSIGCMSGILHLLSKYQNRHKIKSLTFGSKSTKQVKDIVVTVSSDQNQTLASTTDRKEAKLGIITDQNQIDYRRFSCELPIRSPSLSSEIRRSNSVKSPVARLMGLEGVPAVETACSEKRRKILGALEKCDNDLKSLKEMIMAYRSAEKDESDKIKLISKGRENGQEIQQQEKKVKKKVAGAVEEDYSLNLTKLEKRIKLLQNKERKPLENKKKEKKKKTDPPLMMMWRSKAMIENLNEISKEMSWGCNREMGRIGMALQHHIYRDLIEEMVSDMRFISSSCFLIDHSLPFEACRRRLRF